MKKKSKRFKKLIEPLVDKKALHIEDAIKKIKKNCTAKFDESIDVAYSLNLAVQSLLTFLITSSIISGLFSLDASSNFLYLFDRFDLINLLHQYP